MKQCNSVFVAAMCGAMTLCSCAKEVFNEEVREPDSRLTVLTRAGDDEIVATPVGIYVFDGTGAYVTTTTIQDEEDRFSINLPAGDYEVVGVGGMEEERYSLPSTLTTSSAISLISGKVYDDLMAAKSSITLTSGGENTVTLGLERKVMLIKSITINDVPSETSAVSVSIAPLYEHLLLNGNFEGENGSCTIPLTCQTDGTTWKMASNDNSNYQLPSVDKPTISVTIDDKSYSYTSTEKLEANYKINIEGTYTENQGEPTVELTGTITGASWAGEKTIRFNFNETGSETAGGGSTTDPTPGTNPTPSAEIPEVGDLYNGCYVLEVDGNKVTLLSSKERTNIIDNSDNRSQDVIQSKIDAALANWSVDGISATWVLQDKAIATKICSIWDKINSSNTQRLDFANDYFFNNGSKISSYKANKDKGMSESTAVTSSNILRPVTTITIE